MRRLVLATMVISLSALGARVHADGFEADMFHPTPTADGYLAVDGAFPVRHLGFTGGVFAGYAHRPLVLRAADGSVPLGGDVISHQMVTDFVASFGVLGRLELGVDLPLVAYQSASSAPLPIDGGLSATALGDLRVDLKGLAYTLRLRDQNRIGFTAIAGLSVPSGSSSSFTGQGGVTGRPRIVVEWRNRMAAVAVSVGAVLRGGRQLADLYVGHQLSWGVATEVVIWRGLAALGEVSGLIGLAPPGGLKASEAPAEMLFGVRWHAPMGVELSLAGGTGLTRGYGTPDGRVVLGVRYQSPSRSSVLRDSDRDGVPDSEDRCPNEPGPSSNRGCPEVVDSDGDGIVDALDRCPRERGPASNGGCPDPDRDGDGVVDRLDKCPDIKGDPSHDGCPDDDRDKDGVPNVLDRCPDVPGSPDNDGCPDVDSDGDGIVDRLDKCPFDAEVFNGVKDDDGCPDQPAALVELGDDRMVLKEQVIFNSKNEIEPRSDRLLNAVAKVLSLHREITKIRVEGHTDNRGSAIENLDNSRARAAAVRKYLVEHGIDAARITAQGYGPDKPIADNKTETGRARNRRIEVVFAERAGP